MERLRSVKITIEVDTNKRISRETLTLGEYNDEEDAAELLNRASEWLEDQGV
jgi:hypothetical protein